MAKVLLAEDDSTMVSLLKTLLNMEGFEVLALDVNTDVPAVVQRENLTLCSWMSIWVGKVVWRSWTRYASRRNSPMSAL